MGWSSKAKKSAAIEDRKQPPTSVPASATRPPRVVLVGGNVAVSGAGQRPGKYGEDD